MYNDSNIIIKKDTYDLNRKNYTMIVISLSVFTRFSILVSFCFSFVYFLFSLFVWMKGEVKWMQ